MILFDYNQDSLCNIKKNVQEHINLPINERFFYDLIELKGCQPFEGW